MKLILEFLQEFPEPYRTQALENTSVGQRYEKTKNTKVKTHK